MENQRAYDVAILAVGTELISGQVINSNAAWLSEQLTRKGLERILHLTVADSHLAIRWGLETLAEQARLILVMGGLGPTRDDFTRDVIADWLNLPLLWDEASWLHLTERLQGFKIKPNSAQKQQAYFPQGAEILVNGAGTANAFSIRTPSCHVLALPGPPSEIHWLWENALLQYLAPYFPPEPPTRLYRWDCLGKGESDLGEIVEAALQGSGFQTGYRAHFPYIEVKVWVPQADKKAAEKLKPLEAALAPWVVLKAGQDTAEVFLAAVPDLPICLEDLYSQGLLAERLSPLLRLSPPKAAFELCTHWDLEPLSPSFESTLSLQPFPLESQDLKAAKIVLRHDQKIYEAILNSPYQNRQRNVAFLVEKALLQWAAWLNNN